MKKKKDPNQSEFFDWSESVHRPRAHEAAPAKDRNLEPDWGNEYVRPTDPDTSHDAAAELDETRSSAEAYRYFRLFFLNSSDGLNAAEYQQLVERHLLVSGWAKEAANRRADSLRRRLTDLQKKYRLLELRYDLVTTKKGELQRKKRIRNGRQIYYLAAEEVEVQATNEC